MCTRSFENVSQDELKSIEKQMLPGALSESGFLLQGDSLVDVYGYDKSYLQKVGITYDQIADVLETIAEKAYRKQKVLYERNPDGDVYGDLMIDGRYKIKLVSYRGAQTCPFQDPTDKHYYGYEYGSTDVHVEDIKTGKKITYSTLLPHMIRYHHFFESPKVSHRVDPAQIIEMFNIQPGVNYEPKRVTELTWSLQSGSSHLLTQYHTKYNLFFKTLAIDKIKNDKFIAYVTPCRIAMIELYSLDIMDDSYEQMRKNMYKEDNKRAEEWNNKSSGSNSHIYTEDEINTAIKKELELIKLFNENGTLIHPEDKNVRMNMMVIKDSYAHWYQQKEELEFKYKDVNVKVSKYNEYSYGNVGKYTYIQVEEDI